jgi:rhamnulokinase
MGLWLIQECRKEWIKSGQEYSFSEIVKMARNAKAFNSIINPDDTSFYNPDHMPDAIRQFCRKYNEAIPETPGEFARSIFEGLALRYKNTVDGLEKVTGKTISRIHIIGGGCQNELLCQYAANATNKQVIAGPVEATAIGNLMVQAMASGEVSSLGEARSVIKNSFQPKEYSPENVSQWEDAYGKFYEKYVQ